MIVTQNDYVLILKNTLSKLLLNWERQNNNIKVEYRSKMIRDEYICHITTLRNKWFFWKIDVVEWTTFQNKWFIKSINIVLNK